MAILAKVCLLGDGGVGKTTLRNNYLGKGFGVEYLPTLGADFVSKDTLISMGKRITKLKFQIWDLAGQPTFKQIRRMYYRRAVGSLVVFDITRAESLYNLENWLEELIQNSGSPKIVVIILGNKLDLRDVSPISIPSETAERFIIELESKFPEFGNIIYLETSGKTGVNVNKAFNKLGQRILEIIYP
ncbi:MAG: Rab family GTPase [Candidatus Hodarchaeota archaeon]